MLFHSPEVYSQRKLCLGLDYSLFLAERELISERLLTIQLPGDREERRVTKVKDPGLSSIQNKQDTLQSIVGY